jgi:hypothetical protein
VTSWSGTASGFAQTRLNELRLRSRDAHAAPDIDNNLAGSDTGRAEHLRTAWLRHHGEVSTPSSTDIGRTEARAYGRCDHVRRSWT